MSKLVWAKVTLDEYELPVAIADTAVELAKMTHAPLGTIYTEWYCYRKGLVKKTPWRKIEIDD